VNNAPSELDAATADLPPEEIREFLEADWLGSGADPGFREQLRRRLWDWIRSRSGSDTPPAA
jgi:hypothetical protein